MHHPEKNVQHMGITLQRLGCFAARNQLPFSTQIGEVHVWQRHQI